jgi:putative glycosyltransferase (TIGR04372 family)
MVSWKIGLLLQLILSVPIVILVRLLRPLVVVRFRPLSNRIGQFVGSTEIYLCQHDLGMHSGRIIDLFYFQRTVPNNFVKSKWQKQLHVYPFIYPLDRINRMIPGGSSHIVPMPSIRDLNGYMEKAKIHFTFTQDEEDKGRAALESFGIPDGAPFVCFQARDPAYLDERTGLTGQFAYHNYRDTDINTYLPAVNSLSELGYYSLRMGAIVKSPIQSENPRIIDYSTKHRTEFMDIYLSAQCSFYIIDTAGMCAVTGAFRRPILFVNFAPLEIVHTWREGVLTIPKKYWLAREQRYMNTSEILESGAGLFRAVDHFKEMGIELFDNTPEEISAAALEMDARLSGTWNTTKEDEEFQERFWSLFKPGDWNMEFRSRIGAQFLRENPYFLD